MYQIHTMPNVVLAPKQAGNQENYAPNLLNSKKGKIYKAINIFSMSVLVINMTLGTAFMGVFFVAPGEAGATVSGCELEITKTDDGYDPIRPGENLVYHLTLENTGTAKCTGGGVKLTDTFDQYTIYVSADPNPSNTNSTYIRWNFGTVYPGDKREVDLTMQVDSDTPCDTVLVNKLKYWSDQTGNGPEIEEETLVVCEDKMKEIPVQTCTGSGELYLYAGSDPFQGIDTEFTVNYNQLLIFTKGSPGLSFKINGTNTSPNIATTSGSIIIYSLDTAPGDVISVTGAHSNGARSVQGYLSQNSNSPVYDMNTLQVIYDDAKENDMYLTPGNYNYVFFDKYTINSPGGGSDNRSLNVVVEDSQNTQLVNDSYTQPAPIGSQGVVAGSYNITASDIYTMKVNTEDSIYWMYSECEAPPDDPLIIKAYKVVCEDESYLPDWGLSGTQAGEPASITANTAADFVSANSPQCWLKDDWKFQWGYGGSGGVQKYDGDFIGPAPVGTGYGDWKSFDTATGLNGAPAEIRVYDLKNAPKLWVREELKAGFFPFVNPPGSTQDPVSAELYCGTDILNFDNYDWINNLELGTTYYCLALNALKTPDEPGAISGYKWHDQNRDSSKDIGEPILPDWAIYIDENDNGQLDKDQFGPTEPYSMTNQDGYYTFQNLDPGTYKICEEMQSGWTNSTPLCQTVTVASNEDRGVNFGNYFLTYCGDNTVQTPNDMGIGGLLNDGYEECDGDDGVLPGQECTKICTIKTLTFCGDGTKQSPNEVGTGGPLDDGYEQCDGTDGVAFGEECAQNCTINTLTYCGDSIKQTPNEIGAGGPLDDGYEECDDGNDDNFDDCRNDCAEPYCGDGIQDQYEQCDDGNNNDDDGCSSQCMTESGTIYGYKFNDLDRNGSWDDTIEPGLENWLIFIDANGNQEHDQDETFVLTDVNGYYAINGLDPGIYKVCEEMQDEWVATTLECNNIFITYNDSQRLDFGNREKIGSISVCKYYDNGVIGEYEPDTDTQLDWTFTVTNDSTQEVHEVSTNIEEECVKVRDLSLGDYTITEIPKLGGGWINSLPLSGSYQATIDPDNLNQTFIFLNYELPEPFCGDGEVNQPNEECDDGNNENGDGCSANCTTESVGPYCGDGIINQPNEECDDGNTVSGDGCSAICKTEGGGGGGGGRIFLTILDLEAECVTEDTAAVKWRTNKLTESWIVYGVDSDDIEDATSTEKTNKSTSHSVTITGLTSEVEYSFTATAEDGFGMITNTISYNTDECVETRGEEGEPILTIEKVITDEQEFYNAGDTEIEYIITYANIGNLTAFNAVITDILPQGLTYTDVEGNSRQWEVGDLESGETGQISYLVNVGETADPKIYVNIATIGADNFETLEAMADTEVREVIVLAETGFNVYEFLTLILAVSGLVGASGLIRRMDFNS